MKARDLALALAAATRDRLASERQALEAREREELLRIQALELLAEEVERLDDNGIHGSLTADAALAVVNELGLQWSRRTLLRRTRRLPFRVALGGAEIGFRREAFVSWVTGQKGPRRVARPAA